MIMSRVLHATNSFLQPATQRYGYQRKILSSFVAVVSAICGFIEPVSDLRA